MKLGFHRLEKRTDKPSFP